jgi:hypothetical protein
MDIRFITKTLHSYLDYPVAMLLIGAPLLLGLGESTPIALWLSVATGVAAFILTVLTDHKTGVVRVIPYSVHLTVDLAVGVLFLAAPLLFGFSGMDAWFYLAIGATVLSVVSLHQPAGDQITDNSNAVAGAH